MKAIFRNFMLAIIISTFAMWGMLGRRPVDHHKKLTTEQVAAKEAEDTKETLTLFGVAVMAWVLCFWRCSVINRRLAAERFYKQRFNEYMRANSFTRGYR